MTTKDNEDESTIGIRVFVYGTLKSGHGNHAAYLEGNDGARLLGRCYLYGSYGIRDLGFFPCVVETTDGVDRHVVGEVYLVDTNTLNALDCLEGHPNWYERKQVDTPWKNAWCYFMPDRPSYGSDDPKYLENGIWNPSAEEIEWFKGATCG